MCRLQGFLGDEVLAEEGLTPGIFFLRATLFGLGSFDFGAGAIQIGRALRHQCLRLAVVRVEAAHGAYRFGQIGLGELQLHFGIGGIESYQRLSLFDQIGVIGKHADDRAGDLRVIWTTLPPT